MTTFVTCDNKSEVRLSLVAFAEPVIGLSKFTLYDSKREKLGTVDFREWESAKVASIPMIPALPGYYVVSVLHDYEDRSEEPTFSIWQEPVIGWKDTYAVVISCVGYGYEDTYCYGQPVLYPDGKVYVFDMTYATKEKWLEYAVAQETKVRAKA